MARVTTINGETFTVLNREYIPMTRYWELESAYAKPSVEKQKVWAYWKHWFSTTSEGKHDYITICARNRQTFTINGRITIGGHEHAFCIYKTRNILYL